MVLIHTPCGGREGRRGEEEREREGSLQTWGGVRTGGSTEMDLKVKA